MLLRESFIKFDKKLQERYIQMQEAIRYNSAQNKLFYALVRFTIMFPERLHYFTLGWLTD